MMQILHASRYVQIFVQYAQWPGPSSLPLVDRRLHLLEGFLCIADDMSDAEKRTMAVAVFLLPQLRFSLAASQANLPLRNTASAATIAAAIQAAEAAATNDVNQ